MLVSPHATRSHDPPGPVRPVQTRTLIALSVFGVAGLLMWTRMAGPSARIAIDLYRTVVSVPTTFGPPQWSAVGANVLAGAVVGLLVGLIRMRLQNPAIEAAVDAVASPEMVTAARLRAGCALLHVAMGAIAGSVLGALQLPSLGQALSGEAWLSGVDSGVSAALAGMGMFNGPGAPPARDELLVFFVILALLVAALTVLLSAPLVVSLGAVGNALLASSSRALGTSLGATALLVATGPDDDEYVRMRNTRRSRYVLRSMRTALVEGTWSGLVNTAVAVVAVNVAAERLAHRVGPRVVVERVARFAPPEQPPSEVAIARYGLPAEPVTDALVRGWPELPEGQPPLAELLSPDQLHRLQRGDPGAARPLGLLLGGAAVLWRDGGLVVRDASTGAELRRLAAPDGAIVGTASAGWAVVGRAGRGSLVVWDARTGDVHGRIPAHEDALAEVSPDGRWLAVSRPRALEIWDVPEARLARRLSGLRLTALRLSFSPDGRLLAAAGSHEQARLWDVETGRGVWASGRREWPTEVALGDSILATLDGDTLKAFRIVRQPAME